MGTCSCTKSKHTTKLKDKDKEKDNRKSAYMMRESHYHPRSVWTEITVVLDDEEISMIKSALSKSISFKKLGDEKIEAIVKRFRVYSVESNTVVYSENSLPDKIYILKSGGVHSMANGKTDTQFSPGDLFGEEEWHGDTLRAQTVWTSNFSIIFVLEYTAYKDALQSLKTHDYFKKKEAINQINLFSNLSHDKKESIAHVAKILTYENGSYVKDAELTELILVKYGSFECLKNDTVIGILNKDDLYGQKAFECGIPKGTALKALKRSRVFYFGKNTISKILPTELPEMILSLSLQRSMSNHSFFCNFAAFQILNISKAIESSCYSAGHTIEFNQERGFYFVLEGVVATEDTTYKYQGIIDTSEIASRSIQVRYDSILGYISVSHIEEIVENTIEVITQQNKIIKTLKTVRIFKYIPYYFLKNIVAKISVKKFKKDQVIFSEGDIGCALYIIYSGRVDVVRNEKVLRIFQASDFFGEKALVTDRVRTANAIARVPTVCWLITQRDLASILDIHMMSIFDTRTAMRDDSIQLEELIFIKDLSKEPGRRLCLVFCPRKKTPFVLKIIEKARVQKPELIKMERQIMTLVDHPMMIELIKTFKDTSRIFFLLEYAKGDSLFEILDEIKCLGEKNTRFYAACFMLILEYLHSKHIIHRDIKSENILIDSDGYPKLINFEASKLIEEKTYTLVGTPHYMPPEIINGKAYSFSADLWSLGVLLYEMTTGVLPFGDDETDIMRIYDRINEGLWCIPDSSEEMDIMELIEQLLQPNPEHRGNSSDLLDHSFFSGINWDDLMARKMTASYFSPNTHKTQPNFEPRAPVNIVNLLKIELNKSRGSKFYTEF